MHRLALCILALPAPAWAATVEVGPGRPLTTIQAGIDAAQEGDIVAVDAGTYNEVLTLTGRTLTLSARGGVTLRGSDASLITVNGGDLTLNGFVLEPSGGRGLRVDGAATVAATNLTVRGNTGRGQAYNGAAIGVFGGASVTLTNPTLVDNESVASFIPTISRGYGGHVYLSGGSLTVTGGVMRGGDAVRGAAIFHEGSGTLSVTGTTFDDLDASDRGGAAFISGSVTATFTDVTFTNARADRFGGAIRWEGSGGALTLDGATFRNTRAGEFGGAIATNGGGTLTLIDPDLRDSRAPNGGGISAVSLTSLVVTGGRICDARATNGSGGALRIDTVGTASVTGLTITDATATTTGGAILLDTVSSATLDHLDLLGNRAAGGAAVFAQDATGTLENSVLAFSTGQALSLASSTLTRSWVAWFGNPGGNAPGGNLGAATVTADPGIPAYSPDGDCDNDDFARTPTSPLIDAADPATTDPDGSRADIGARGGATAPPALFVDGDNDGFIAAFDCDDTTALVQPGLAETCDGVDEDCDGVIDGPTANGATDWYTDADADNYGTGDAIRACDQPDGTTDVDGDCDDANPDVRPRAPELCNGIDDDCNGDIDGANSIDKRTWYRDDDGDGVGDAAQSIGACDQPDGFVLASGDCAPDDPDVSPRAPERCNQTDDDCDGEIDEDPADPFSWYVDSDGDGWGDDGPDVILACANPGGRVRQGGDCAPADPTVHPNAEESCEAAAIDANCDGFTGTADNDGDGFAACDDCDDGDPDAYPGAPDVWYDGLLTDCERTSDYDADLDGFEALDYGGDDCVDTDPAIYPGAPVVYNDDIDDDCDGELETDLDRDEDLNPGACEGCASGGAGFGAGLPVVLALLARRRRR